MRQNILRLPEVKKLTGLSRTTIYVYMKENRFPKHIKLGPRCNGWLEDEVDQWIDSRISTSRPETTGTEH